MSLIFILHNFKFILLVVYVYVFPILNFIVFFKRHIRQIYKVKTLDFFQKDNNKEVLTLFVEYNFCYDSS